MSSLDLDIFPTRLSPPALTEYNDTAPKTQNKGIAFVVLLSIVVLTNLVGLFGNILLIKVMHKSRSVNQSYRLYLIALAITDSMNIFSRLIDSLEEFLDYQYGKYLLHKNSWSCRIYDFIVGIFTIVSAWLIVCITCERFLVMYFPLKGRVWWKTHYMRVFATVIVTAFISQSPRLYFMERDAKEGYCRFKLEGIKFIIAISFDSFSRFFCVYGIPGITVLILNLFIILRMYDFIKRSTTLRLQEYRQRYPTGALSCSSTTTGATVSNNCHQNNNNVNNNNSNASNNNPNSSNSSSINVSNPQGANNTASADELPTVGEKTRRDRKRATGILVTISCTYLVCMAPESIATFYWSLIMHAYEPALVPKDVDDSYIRYVYLYRFIYQIFTAISYGSNFFTYIAFGKRFRKEVNSVLRFTSTSSSLDPNQQHVFHPENVPLKKCPVYGWHGCPRQAGDYFRPKQSGHGRRHNSNYGEWAPPHA